MDPRWNVEEPVDIRFMEAKAKSDSTGSERRRDIR